MPPPLKKILATPVYREETSIGEDKFGFMLGKGTIDAIFAAKQMMEKHREMQKELHMVFIDLE